MRTFLDMLFHHNLLMLLMPLLSRHELVRLLIVLQGRVARNRLLPVLDERQMQDMTKHNKVRQTNQCSDPGTCCACGQRLGGWVGGVACTTCSHMHCDPEDGEKCFCPDSHHEHLGNQMTHG